MKKFKLISLIFSLTTILSSHSLAMRYINNQINISNINPDDSQDNYLTNQINTYSPNDSQDNDLANEINGYVENNNIMNTAQNNQQDITNSEFADKENKHLTIQETLELLDKIEDGNQNTIDNQNRVYKPRKHIYIPPKQKKFQKIYKKNRIKDINLTINTKNSVANKLKNIDNQKQQIFDYRYKMGQFMSDKERKLNDKKIFSKKTLPKYDFKANKDTINESENINSHSIKKNIIRNINFGISLSKGTVENLKNMTSKKEVLDSPYKMGEFVSNKKSKLNNKKSKLNDKKTLSEYDFKSNKKNTTNKLKKYKQLIKMHPIRLKKNTREFDFGIFKLNVPVKNYKK